MCTQMVDTAPYDRPSAPGVVAQAHLSHPRGAAIVSVRLRTLGGGGGQLGVGAASVLLVAEAVDRGDHVGAALDDGLLHGERVRHLVRVLG